MSRTVQVIGPAYLDRVLRVDAPLTAEGEPPLDQSVDGAWAFGPGLVFQDPDGRTLTVEPPSGWPGPFGNVRVSGPLGPTRSVRGASWHDDLGGMGAGYAAALGGTLVSALGPDGDPLSRDVTARLRAAGIEHRPIRVADAEADWTLLLTSGPHGDKLPVGFRGCHARLSEAELAASVGPCALRVVAAVENRLAAPALAAPGAGLRFFAPTMRNVRDRGAPVGRFARHVDVLSCNRREWEGLDDRESVAWQVSLLAVTDGPNGAVVRFTTPEGESGRVAVPSFPRSRPPVDTNRAGEAFGATLVTVLLDGGFTDPGRGVEESLVRAAAVRASAASALVLDRPGFGFPTAAEIDAALRAGRVEAPAAFAGPVPGYNAGDAAGPAVGGNR